MFSGLSDSFSRNSGIAVIRNARLSRSLAKL